MVFLSTSVSVLTLSNCSTHTDDCFPNTVAYSTQAIIFLAYQLPQSHQGPYYHLEVAHLCNYKWILAYSDIFKMSSTWPLTFPASSVVWSLWGLSFFPVQEGWLIFLVYHLFRLLACCHPLFPCSTALLPLSGQNLKPRRIRPLSLGRSSSEPCWRRSHTYADCCHCAFTA